MGKHLLDETAEFRLPTLGRHAAEGTTENTAGDGLEATQRFDAELPPPVTRRGDDAGAH